MTHSNKKTLKHIGKFIFEVFYNVVVIVVLVVILRTYIISPFKVQGHSMSDTLMNGQLILINKIGYLTAEPKRGDVIVFLPPVTTRDDPKFELSLTTNTKGEALALNELETIKQNSYCKKRMLQRFWFCQENVKAGDFLYLLPVSQANKISGYNWSNSQRRLITPEEIENNALSFEESDQEYRIKIYNPQGADHFVKRIIGIPGDTIRFEEEGDKGFVYLKKAGEEDFVKLEEPYLNEINADRTRLPDWVKEDTFTVPEDMYFGMGDNRGASNDSRSFRYPETLEEVHFITKDQMAGKVMMVLLPLWDFHWIGTQEVK